MRRSCRVPRPGGPQRRAVRRVGWVDRRRAAQAQPRLTTPGMRPSRSAHSLLAASLAGGQDQPRPGHTEVAPPPGHPTGVEFGQQREHEAPARSGGVAELADGEPAGVGAQQVRGHRAAPDRWCRGGNRSRRGRTTWPRRTSSRNVARSMSSGGDGTKPPSPQPRQARVREQRVGRPRAGPGRDRPRSPPSSPARPARGRRAGRCRGRASRRRRGGRGASPPSARSLPAS